TEPIDLGPFVLSDGVTLVPNGSVVTFTIRLDGQIVASNPAALTTTNGHAIYIPLGTTDTGTAGNLKIQATTPTSLLYFCQYQIIAPPPAPPIIYFPTSTTTQGSVLTTTLPLGWQNSLYVATLTIVDTSGNPVNLGSVSLEAEFWVGSIVVPPTIVIKTASTTQGSISVGGAGNNQVTLSITPLGTAKSGNFNWVLRPTDNSVPPFASGTLCITSAPVIV